MRIPFTALSAEADERAEMIFFQALKQQLDEREAFLNQECGTDTRLRAEVDGLLRDHEKAGSFLSANAPVSPEMEAEFARLKPEEVGERIGNYKLLEQIGEGGFGVVWVAEQEKPMRRRAALKIIKLGMDTKDAVARFEQERQALAVMESLGACSSMALPGNQPAERDALTAGRSRVARASGLQVRFLER